MRIFRKRREMLFEMTVLGSIRSVVIIFVICELAACSGGGSSQEGKLRATTTVNRSPVITEIVDTQNNPDGPTRIQLIYEDADGDHVEVSVQVENPSIAAASIDALSQELLVLPMRVGTTRMTVYVSDGKASAGTQFNYSVREVTRSISLSTGPDGTQAISLFNKGTSAVSFGLTHNGFQNFATVEQMIASIVDAPVEYVGEPFERKLWRFLRDNVWHAQFLSPAPWLMTPTVLINSLGFGMCSSVAAAYAALAGVAGYEARIWDLGGHVVPEIRVGKRWQMFDPDLAVYYLLRDGVVAAVSDLAADPTLVTSPSDPLYGRLDLSGYSDLVGEIYATDDDNFIWSSLLALPEGLSGQLVLPPGARLTYPGRWTSPPISYGDDDVPVEVDEFAQAVLTIEKGWTGAVNLPWILWDILGEGSVRINGKEYTAESDSLRQHLHSVSQPASTLTVSAAWSSLQLVFLVNPLRFGLQVENIVDITSVDPWRIDPVVEILPVGNRIDASFPASLRKPAS